MEQTYASDEPPLTAKIAIIARCLAPTPDLKVTSKSNRHLDFPAMLYLEQEILVKFGTEVLAHQEFLIFQKRFQNLTNISHSKYSQNVLKIRKENIQYMLCGDIDK